MYFEVSSALVMRWIGWPLVEARHFPLATASLSILSYDPVEPVIALWNAAVTNLLNTARCLPIRPMTHRSTRFSDGKTKAERFRPKSDFQ